MVKVPTFYVIRKAQGLSKATSPSLFLLLSIEIFIFCNFSCQHCALRFQYGIKNPREPPADSQWYDFLFPSQQSQHLNLPCDIASNSIRLKPANPDPKNSQRGSSSADLDCGVINDDDDDDALEEAGMNTISSTVGKFSFRLEPTSQTQGSSGNLR